MAEDFRIVAGTANIKLAHAIAALLHVESEPVSFQRFPDTEVGVRLGRPVRDAHVFIVQPTSPPVDSNLMELLAWSDACRRASARRITAVIPYFGYARSDKRQLNSEPIAASLVAQLIQSAGVQDVITLDLHSPQIEGFFHVPVQSLSAAGILCNAARENLPQNAVVVSPDLGRVNTATQLAERLSLPVAILHKQRQSGTQTSVTRIVGDVRHRACLIVDDMISTGGTIASSIEALLSAGARHEIVVAATHALLVCDARERLMHPAIKRLIVTDSIHVERTWQQLKVVTIAPLLAAAIEQAIEARLNV